MSTAFSVSSVWRFESNHERVLGGIAKSAAQATAQNDALTASVKATTQAMRSLARIAPQLQVTMRDMSAMTRTLTVAFDKIGTSASMSSARTVAGFDAMRTSAREAAASVDASASSMITRLRGVSAASSGAASSMRGIGRGSMSGRGGFFAGAGSVARGFGTGVGLAGLATEAIGVKTASSLQDASVQTGIALGRSNAWVKANLEPLAYNISKVTAQNVGDSMGILRTMSTAGINDPAQLQALALPIAKFADTQFLGKNQVPFDQSVSQLATLSHQLNLRTAEQIKPFANTLFKISNDMPDSLKTAATQIRYYGAAYSQAGVSPSEILQLQATADRVGYGGGKSGTGLNMILRHLQSPTKSEYAAQSALGLLDANGHSRFIDQRTGAFNPDALFQDLNAKYNAAIKSGSVASFNATLAKTLPSNAAQIAAAFSSNAGIAQRKNVTQTLSRVQDLESAQARLMGTLNHQTQVLSTNFSSLAAILAGPLIKPLTDLMTQAASGVGRAESFFQAHPQATQVGSGVLAVVAAAGAYQAFKLLGGVGIFVHAAADAAKHSVGVGGWARFGHAGGAAHEAAAAGRGAGIAEMALDFITLMPMLRGLRGIGRVGGRLGGAAKVLGIGGGLFEGIGALVGRAGGAVGRAGGSIGSKIGGIADLLHLTPIFERLGGGAKVLGIGAQLAAKVLPFLAGGLARLGLRAIPVVGNILMIVDALKFMGTHSFDIGKIIGQTARWLHDRGWPLIQEGVVYVFNGIKDTIWAALKGIWDSITGLFTGTHKGGLWDVVANLSSGIRQGYTGQYDNVNPALNPAGTLSPVALNQLNVAAAQRNAGGPRRTVVVNGNIILPSVKNPRDFAAALHDHRSVNAAAGASMTTILAPPVSTTGIGRGR